MYQYIKGIRDTIASRLSTGIQLAVGNDFCFDDEPLMVSIDSENFKSAFMRMALHANAVMAQGSVVIAVCRVDLSASESKELNLPVGEYCEITFSEIVKTGWSQPRSYYAIINPAQRIDELLSESKGRVRFINTAVDCMSFRIHIPCLPSAER